MLPHSSLLLLVFLSCRCSQPGPLPIQAAVLPVAGKMNGLTLVAPPEPFSENPMPAVKALGAGWIAVVPYAFTRTGTPTVRYQEAGGQWWGERPVGVRETIRLAHEAGIRVMLKPQVYVPRSWTGNLRFATPEEWAAWEADYERYILRMARLADSTGVELFCIGTEFRKSVEQRPQFWFSLIKNVRQVFPGKLTYSANWDDWQQVPFWKELDFIGLSGYFPLVQADTPGVAELKTAWQPIVQNLRAFSQKQSRPVLFTEFGYLSVDGAGWRNWELERDISSRPVNEQAQANCMEAMLSTFQAENWWAGGFLWKWFPNMRGHEGYPERDYTPQGKHAEPVLQKWYRY
ncbi:MAG: hypothetical protein IPM98_16620 [Lewinellaceae bacterium]|nr:hypothetical protein [Lewinellaceae bacterium]